MTDTSFAGMPGVTAKSADALRKLGITTPFDIQTQVIPPAVERNDILAQAQTGSGKTLAFGLPLVHIALSDTQEPNGPIALVLVPTRELAVQVHDDIAVVAEPEEIRVATAFGGSNIAKQARACAEADIVVATPGRLTDLIDRGDVSMDCIDVLVLDEADRMLDMGFAPQVDRIVKHLPRDRQTMLFSATLDGAIAKLINKHTHDPVTCTVEPDTSRMGVIDHHFQPTDQRHRVATLVEMLDIDRGQSVVFVRTKRGVDRLLKKLKANKVNATRMHGGMTQSARLRELNSFRAGKVDTMVATDVFARGLDLDTISHVINYDPPADADTYLHRIGRTGRAGKNGMAITLVTPENEDLMYDIADEIGLREVPPPN